MLLHKLLDVTLGVSGGVWEIEISMVVLEMDDVRNKGIRIPLIALGVGEMGK
ncbi:MULTISPECIES: hypothetical protein [Paenibacillus]|uniref:hypothetical protein n=1 Tax=Paenibacillus TaxID=44249 RepID=UPI0018CFA955|nr:hypothetical protein [Paenibacillus sp. FSL P4-0081]